MAEPHPAGRAAAERLVYGGGLHKLEPNGLANIRATGLQTILPADTLAQLYQQILLEPRRP